MNQPRPEIWDRLEALFTELVDLEPDERRARLDALGPDDAALREELEELLASHAEVGDFIEPPATPDDAFAQLTPGTRLGPWKIVRFVGQGGMGSVHEAERDDGRFEMRAAIKVVRPGLLGAETSRRMVQERAILAQLQHPAIARLLDGGETEDRRPWLAMEFVEGEPIDAWCDRHRRTLEERVDLFLDVCAAVTFAHQKLVVHRDIKPGNVLVRGDGTACLLDFGIAKLLRSDAGATAETGGAMTPEYASPEQVRGDAVTTASDVYTLGVLLFGLLAGTPPYRITTRTPGEIVKVVCDQDPEAPSATVMRRGTEELAHARRLPRARLHRALTGDLDAIVMKAMRKEPEHRYASVESLAEDLRRWRAGHVVEAHRGGWRYRAGKSMRRHRVAWIGVAAVVLALVGGIVTTTRQGRRAQRESELAQDRTEDVMELAHALVFDFHDGIADLAGSMPIRKKLVEQALEYLQALSVRPGDSARLRRELAATWHRLGEIQGNPYFSNIGDSAGAITSYRAAIGLWQQLVDEAGDADDLLNLSKGHGSLADVYWPTGDVKKSLEHYEKGRRIRERLVREHPDNLAFRRSLAAGHGMVARTHFQLGDVDEAEKHIRRCTELFKDLVDRQPENDKAANDYAMALDNLADVETARGRTDDAERHLLQSLEIRKGVHERNPGSLVAQRSLAGIYGFLAQHAIDRKQLDKALEWSKASLDMREKIQKADPQSQGMERELSMSLTTYGDALRHSGRYDEAQPIYERTLEIDERLARRDESNTLYQSDVAISLDRVAEVQTHRGLLDDAMSSYSRALEIREKLTETDPANTDFKHQLSVSYMKVAYTHRKLAESEGQSEESRRAAWEAARAVYRKARDHTAKLAERGLLTTPVKKRLAEIDEGLAACDAALR